MNPLIDIAAHPVIAHRGSSAEAPENTLAAFEAAVQRGADALELDVRLTADGAPVVIHDSTLDRTTDGSGPVAAQTLAELRSVDAGSSFTPDRGRSYPFRGKGTQIPTLGEVLWTFPRMTLLVEIKEAQAQEAVRRVLVQEDAAERCVVASEHQEALQAFDQPPFIRGVGRRNLLALLGGVPAAKSPGGKIQPAIGSRASSRFAGPHPRLRRCGEGTGLSGPCLDGRFAGHRAKAVAPRGGGDCDEQARSHCGSEARNQQRKK